MMKKKVIISVLIGAVVIGGLWFRADAIIHSKPEAAPNATQPSPNSTTTEPSIAPAESPTGEASEKPSPQPSPTKRVDPPVKETALSDLLAANLPELNFKTNNEGIAIVTNTTSNFVLVNKKRLLPSSYEPKDLTVPNVPFSFSGSSPKKQLRKEAASALESLFEAAKDDGIDLKAVSGYRSYATQKSIFQSNANKKGEDVANRTSARPGQSEHQTGLAMDVSSASVGYALEESFGKTKEGIWLAEHAADHGFIIRFLKGKEAVTGYSYEPWHIRYIGKAAAKEIMDKKVTLEEYFDAAAATIHK